MWKRWDARGLRRKVRRTGIGAGGSSARGRQTSEAICKAWHCSNKVRETGVQRGQLAEKYLAIGTAVQMSYLRPKGCLCAAVRRQGLLSSWRNSCRGQKGACGLYFCSMRGRDSVPAEKEPVSISEIAVSSVALAPRIRGKNLKGVANWP